MKNEETLDIKSMYLVCLSDKDLKYVSGGMIDFFLMSLTINCLLDEYQKTAIINQALNCIHL